MKLVLLVRYLFLDTIKSFHTYETTLTTPYSSLTHNGGEHGPAAWSQVRPREPEVKRETQSPCLL